MIVVGKSKNCVEQTLNQTSHTKVNFKIPKMLSDANMNTNTNDIQIQIQVQTKLQLPTGRFFRQEAYASRLIEILIKIQMKLQIQIAIKNPNKNFMKDVSGNKPTPANLFHTASLSQVPPFGNSKL